MNEKKLYKSKKDKKIFGVCGGVAEYLGIDPTIVRVLWLATILFGGVGVLVYLICALVIPDNPNEISF